VRHVDLPKLLLIYVDIRNYGFPNMKSDNSDPSNLLLGTKDVARLLGVNEKMVYSLISEKGLPATKITGKWLFPRRLVEQWIDKNTINHPGVAMPLPEYHGLLIIAGSNDILLDRTISLFNRSYPDHVAVFGNLGSLGGLRAMGRKLCHIASSHLLQENEEEYNFAFARAELVEPPAVVNFSRREQGLLLAKGNPKKVGGVADLGRRGLKIVNRAAGTGTRLLFDQELSKAGLQGDKIDGYTNEAPRHLDVGLEVLSGRADVGPGIRAVAGLLGLDFIPLRWERFDLLITRDRFFDRGIQLLLGLLHEKAFIESAQALEGYDLSLAGKMVFPQDSNYEE
jgi:putative molybdopterin biosynthesis protein